MFPTCINCAKASWRAAPSATHTFKRAQKGLFGGKSIRFGNNVPESHQKTRRTWMPNIQTTSLYSALLNERIRIKATTSVIRDIDHVGGLDAYLLHRRRAGDELGELGRELRERVAAAAAAARQRTPRAAKVTEAVAGTS